MNCFHFQPECVGRQLLQLFIVARHIFAVPAILQKDLIDVFHPAPFGQLQVQIEIFKRKTCDQPDILDRAGPHQIAIGNVIAHQQGGVIAKVRRSDVDMAHFGVGQFGKFSTGANNLDAIFNDRIHADQRTILAIDEQAVAHPTART